MRSLGDDAFELTVNDAGEAQALATALRGQGSFLNVVAGLASVAVQFNAATTTLKSAVAIAAEMQAMAVTERSTSPAEIQISVSYGGDAGPDLSQVCETLDMSVAEFVAQHTAHRHTVEMLGFIPGFAYLNSLGSSFSVPRLASPRRRVAAGSIGFVDGRSGLYALSGPGGWPLIGRTERVLFDAEADEPFVLQPRMQIRFVARA